jgi:hypothetical protein
MVGALQVEIGLRGGEAASVEIRFEPQVRMEPIALSQSEACPFHAAEEHLVDTGAARVGDLLHGAAQLSEGEPVLLLDWPVCVQAVCLECRKKWHPMRRVGWLRRRGVCPGCGSRRVREEETLTRVARDSVWATAGLAELGLPDRHLHTVRFEAAT